MIECLLSLCLATSEPARDATGPAAIQTLEFSESDQSISCMDFYGHRFQKGHLGFESCVSGSAQPVLLKSQRAPEEEDDSRSN